jgi:hypothetical protein
LARKNSLTKKCLYKSILAIVIVTSLIISITSALPTFTRATTIIDTAQQEELVPADSTSPPEVKTAGPESQFRVEIAYAYVGPPQPDQVSYYSSRFNATMVLSTKYPSAIYLNFTRLPSNQIGSCDAVIQVYGIKIVSDTGITEYHAYSAGTNYTAFTSAQRMILLRYSDILIDSSQYSSPRGIFNFKWENNTSILSHMMGSAGTYTIPDKEFNETSQSQVAPNSVSVTVYRLGYVMISNGLVTIYKDAASVEKPVATVTLDKYNGGFIYNTFVPDEQLSKIDLFHP